jgi:predicted restriction endonuclease
MRVLPKWDYQFFLSLTKNISSFKKNGKKNQHKPLLLLFSIEALKLNSSSVLKYVETYPLFISILQSYSKSKIASAADPFWYLQNDYLWEVFSLKKLRFRKDKDFPPHASLIAAEAVGKMPFWLEKTLSRNPEMLTRAANQVAKEIDPINYSLLISRVDKLLIDKRK